MSILIRCEHLIDTDAYSLIIIIIITIIIIIIIPSTRRFRAAIFARSGCGGITLMYPSIWRVTVVVLESDGCGVRE